MPAEGSAICYSCGKETAKENILGAEKLLAGVEAKKEIASNLHK